jgi:hypothetical protein
LTSPLRGFVEWLALSADHPQGFYPAHMGIRCVHFCAHQIWSHFGTKNDIAFSLNKSGEFPDF